MALVQLIVSMLAFTALATPAAAVSFAYRAVLGMLEMAYWWVQSPEGWEADHRAWECWRNTREGNRGTGAGILYGELTRMASGVRRRTLWRTPQKTPRQRWTWLFYWGLGQLQRTQTEHDYMDEWAGTTGPWQSSTEGLENKNTKGRGGGETNLGLWIISVPEGASETWWRTSPKLREPVRMSFQKPVPACAMTLDPGIRRGQHSPTLPLVPSWERLEDIVIPEGQEAGAVGGGIHRSLHLWKDPITWPPSQTCDL